MALRLGKKKDAPTEPPVAIEDDWSEAALLGDTTEPQSTIPAPSPAMAPASNAPDPADDFVFDTFDSAPPKKTMSPALLAGGLVLLLTALGVGAYFTFFSAPAEEPAPIVAPRVVQAPTPPPPPAPPKTKLVKTAPRVAAPKVPAGSAGIATANAKVPAIKPRAGKLPAVVPKPNMPTPVPIMPDGMAAQPGKGTSTGTTVQIVGSPIGSSPAASLPPSLQAQLKALWKQGADAKHQRNYNGARQAWGKMLKLRPGHPGVQQAIEKLPR